MFFKLTKVTKPFIKNMYHPKLAVTIKRFKTLRIKPKIFLYQNSWEQ